MSLADTPLGYPGGVAISLLALGAVALIATALAGSFRLHRRVPRNVVASHTAGGIAMGYGASIAFGCNIGACFSGIASLSLHGWIWGAMALAGTATPSTRRCSAGELLGAELLEQPQPHLGDGGERRHRVP